MSPQVFSRLNDLGLCLFQTPRSIPQASVDAPVFSVSALGLSASSLGLSVLIPCMYLNTIKILVPGQEAQFLAKRLSIYASETGLSKLSSICLVFMLLLFIKFIIL